MTVGKRKEYFRTGDPASKILDHAWANEVEKRLAQLESLKAHPPLEITKRTNAAFVLALTKSITEFEFVRLTEQLNPYCNAVCNVLFLEAFIDGLDDGSSTSTCDDIPLKEDSNFPLTVWEIGGVTSVINTTGLAIKFKRAKDEIWIFFPWPLAEGDNRSNYKFDTKQALIHGPNNWLQWMDIGPCTGTAAATTSSSGL